MDTPERCVMLQPMATSAAPRLSVIVPCLNPGPTLATALESVWTQDDAPVEVIVIDGGSDDGTREWLEARREQLAAFVSARDGGVYQAMNKGVALAKGEWVYFLGADDQLEGSKVLSEVMARASASDADVLVGEIAYADGRIYQLPARVNAIARNFVHHQGAFYRRQLFADHGGFDSALAVQADYAFNLRLRKADVRFIPLPLRITRCGTGGLSDGGAWRVYREEIKVRHAFFPGPRAWLWDALSIVRFVRKQVRRRLAKRDQNQAKSRA